MVNFVFSDSAVDLSKIDTRVIMEEKVQEDKVKGTQACFLSLFFFF